MSLKSRRICEKDYPIINKWCADWGFPEVAIAELLPAYGLIISDDDQDIVCGFLYLTDSVFAHPEWIVSNKSHKNKANHKLAFKKLIESFERYAKKEGYKLLLMSVKNPFLIKTLKNNGFLEADSKMTNLIKEI